MRKRKTANLEIYEKIITKRQEEYDAGKYGFRDETKLNLNFIDYFEKLTNERYESIGNHGNWESTHRHLKIHFGEKLLFRDLTPEKLKAFKYYLDTKAITPRLHIFIRKPFPFYNPSSIVPFS